MDLPPDFRDLLEAFARESVEAVLVGGYAVAFHGRPRATKDIDLVLAGDGDNLARAARALSSFGALQRRPKTEPVCGWILSHSAARLGVREAAGY